ncbi:MAG TPA: DUF72 domain-containing protein [Propionibacteriaceae bacterium]
MTVRIGISGWTYPRWRGTFYPRGLPQRQELRYAAERMNSVEINGSFYSLQRRSSFEAWAASVSEDFVFAVKGGRFITHMKKLSGIETPLANFLASGVLALDQKLGPILWQLPPNLGFSADRMDAFFAQLPRSAGSAAKIAARHDQRIPDDRALTKAAHPRHRLRHAIEPRHESFRTPEFYRLLRRYKMALVISDNPGKWPIFTEITTDLVYVRLHGHDQLYVSGYSDHELDEWAAKIRSWTERGCDVYVYFDNDAKVHAPFDAMSLMERLGVRAQ